MAGGSWVRQNIPKKPHFQKSAFLLPQVGKKRTKCMAMMYKSSTEIMKFISPGSGVQTLGWGHYDHIKKCIKS